MNYIHTDVCILGSGLAGLLTALKTPDDMKVSIFAKGNLYQTATNYAQGGLAAVSDITDDFQLHIDDTLKIGRGICHEKIVKMVVEEGPHAVEDLLNIGVEFVKKDGQFDLHQEGGHSRRRILHANDATGQAIQTALLKKIEQKKNIKIHSNVMAIDLIVKEDQVVGVLFEGNKVVYSNNVVIACGGASKVYRYCTFPEVSSGDGIAMAMRAGLPVANMEFMQFHPTCLYHSVEKNFLITEALRGEGAQLLNHELQPLMKDFKNKDLEGRDVIAATIDKEIKNSGFPHVYLDARMIGKAKLQEKFPTIYTKLQSLGIHMEKDLIPVVPAAHYTCGGIEVDENGRTEMRGLFAVGESSFTGLHGANRLASNSLLEAAVFASRVAKVLIKDHPPERLVVKVHSVNKQDDSYNVFISHLWNEIRTIMWTGVGIVRSRDRLRWAQTRLLQVECEVHNLHKNIPLKQDYVELRNLCLCALLIVESALRRLESRGLHIMEDYPESNSEYERDTVITLRDLPRNMVLVSNDPLVTRRPLIKVIK